MATPKLLLGIVRQLEPMTCAAPRGVTCQLTPALSVLLTINDGVSTETPSVRQKLGRSRRLKNFVTRRITECPVARKIPNQSIGIGHCMGGPILSTALSWNTILAGRFFPTRMCTTSSVYVMTTG